MQLDTVREDMKLNGARKKTAEDRETDEDYSPWQPLKGQAERRRMEAR